MSAMWLFAAEGRGHPSWEARALVFIIGLCLCSWGAGKARHRTVLIPTLTLLLAIGSGTMAFAVFPVAFDSLSFAFGISYPPVFYLLIALTALLLVILHLAIRLSLTDERCRKLSQELALLQMKLGSSGGHDQETSSR